MFGGGSEALIPYDLSDKYPATIAAIGNSFSSISGFATPWAKTLIIGNETDSVSKWNNYILVIAAANIIGGFIFIFNVKAKKLNFSSKQSDKNQDLEQSTSNPSKTYPKETYPRLSKNSVKNKTKPIEQPKKEHPVAKIKTKQNNSPPKSGNI